MCLFYMFVCICVYNELDLKLTRKWKLFKSKEKEWRVNLKKNIWVKGMVGKINNNECDKLDINAFVSHIKQQNKKSKIINFISYVCHILYNIVLITKKYIVLV